MYVVVYNPLATNRSTIVRIPVSSDATFRVTRVEEETKTGAGAVHTIRSTAALPIQETDDVKHVLSFHSGILPPVGAVTFRVVMAPDVNENDLLAGSNDARSILELDPPFQDISNGILTARFDRSTGMLNKISANGVELNVTQSWGYYTSFDSEFDKSNIPPRTPPQNSGAYIFRPSDPEQELVPLSAAAGKAIFVNTSVGTEVHVSFQEPWIRQVTRVLSGQPYLEVEYTVGPIPIDDGRGKEIVSRLNTPIKSQGEFYTDSNGREFVERRRNSRPTWSMSTYEPVAGNYYPVNAAIFVQDTESALSVAVDRSQGGASLRDGSLELMVQRRTLVDDGRGVDEPLNETAGGMTAYPPYANATRRGEGVIICGTHRIMVGKGPVGASLARSVMDGIFAQPLIFVGSASSKSPVAFRRASFSSLQAGLPRNVMLVTFSKLHDRESETFLIRLGHQYGPGEDAALSATVQVDLARVFDGYNIVSVTEKTLSGNQDLASYERRRLHWTHQHRESAKAADNSADETTIVALKPLDIRTFEVFVSNALHEIQ